MQAKRGNNLKYRYQTIPLFGGSKRWKSISSTVTLFRILGKWNSFDKYWLKRLILLSLTWFCQVICQWEGLTGKNKRKQLSLEHGNHCLIGLCLKMSVQGNSILSRCLQLFLISCLCLEEEYLLKSFKQILCRLSTTLKKILCKYHNLISSWHRE